MVSDQEIGKKEIETNDLIAFLEAREVVLDETLSPLLGLHTESPDFICIRPNGEPVGVELTKVTADRDLAFWDRLRYGEVRIEPYKTLERIHHLIDRKEKSRADRYAKMVSDNILVLQFVDGSMGQLRGAFDGLEDDFTSHGFSEIWIADYSGLEAYGDIELFGLFPSLHWGRHRRLWPDRKPYG